jgi:hypothetical protein
MSVLGKRRKFNATHYMTESLWSLAEWRGNQVEASAWKMIVQADHARRHIAPISLTFLDKNEITKFPRQHMRPICLLLISSCLATLNNSCEELNFPIGIRFSTQSCRFWLVGKSDLEWRISLLDGWASELCRRSWTLYRVNNVFIEMDCDGNHSVTRCPGDQTVSIHFCMTKIAFKFLFHPFNYSILT